MLVLGVGDTIYSLYSIKIIVYGKSPLKIKKLKVTLYLKGCVQDITPVMNMKEVFMNVYDCCY